MSSAGSPFRLAAAGWAVSEVRPDDEWGATGSFSRSAGTPIFDPAA